MCNGWPQSRRFRRTARSLVVPLLAVAMAGCAQQRQNLLGDAPARSKPFGLGAFGNQTEPGLQVKAPFVDVQVADRDDKPEGEDASSPSKPSDGSTRVGLFRSPSSESSLATPRPIN